MVEKLNNVEARQGQRGKPVLMVLLASLALLVICLLYTLTLPTIAAECRSRGAPDH